VALAEVEWEVVLQGAALLAETDKTPPQAPLEGQA
jgi:hypothetical protein